MDTKADIAFLIDHATGTTLFEKNADKVFPPASLTKMMTMAVVFDAIKAGSLSLEDTFTVSENAWRTRLSRPICNKANGWPSLL